MLTCSGVISANTRSVAFVSGEWGAAESAAIADLLSYTIRPSPFFVCGSMMRACVTSTSSQRSPGISERRIPVVVATPACSGSLMLHYFSPMPSI